MDKFLKEHHQGQLVDSRNEFTLDRSRSRVKLLESIPKDSKDAPYRLFDSAVRKLGVHPIEAITYYPGDNTREASVSINLPLAESSFTRDLIQELRRPFSQNPATSTMARAIFRAVGRGARVDIGCGGFLESLIGQGSMTLEPGGLDIADDLPESNRNGLRIRLTSLLELEDYRTYTKQPVRRILNHFSHAERLLPLESFSRDVSGYFDYRTKPFTAIRSYASLPTDWAQESLLLDLWEGPYASLSDQTLLLDKKEGGKFLFIRWRPSYGCPTFLHHNLEASLKHGEQNYRATFWVETSGSAATVHFYSNGVFSDPVRVDGPMGLTGIVLWPDLTHDLWGTKLVKNERYEEALKWTQQQVTATSDCLAENLDAVLERLQNSDLVKKSYLDETVAKIRGAWA